MSQIISKAFDASKKIIRSVFKGSPNLFTSSDLNRQIEAIKYQLDLLDDKTGFMSDIDLSSATFEDNTVSVTPTFTILRCKGCDFSPASDNLTIDMQSFRKAYLVLLAKVSEVTYETDSSHEIAGAKFADGTSQPAANQLVYTDEKFALLFEGSTPDAEDETIIGVIAMFQITSEGTLSITKNYSTGITDTPFLKTENRVINSDPTLTGQIIPGTSYDQALSILQNRLNNLKNSMSPAWTNMIVNNQQGDVKFRITDGVFQVKIPQKNVTVITSRNGEIMSPIGGFSSEVKSKLLAYFKSLGITKDLMKANKGSYYARFGNFGTVWMSFTDTTSTIKNNSGILMQVTLTILANSESLDPTDVYLACVPIVIQDIGDTSATTTLNGQVDYGWTGNGIIHLPSIYGAVPLPGFDW